MTPNRVTVALEKYTKCIDSVNQASLKTLLASASNSCTDELMYLPVKKPVTTVLLSIFLGGLGVDRFYLGDNKMGIAKLIARIVTTILANTISLGAILNFAVSVWLFADIFITYKLCKSNNYALLSTFLSKHKEVAKPRNNRGNNNLNSAMSGSDSMPSRGRLSDFANELEMESSDNNEDAKEEVFGYTEPERGEEDGNTPHTTGYNSPNDMDEDNEESAPLGGNTSRDDGRRAGEDSSSGRSTSNPFSW